MQSCKWISDDVFSRSTENIVGFQLQTYIYFQREIRLHIDNRKKEIDLDKPRDTFILPLQSRENKMKNVISK